MMGEGRKHIAVDLTSLSDHLSGLERYGMEITNALLDGDNETHYLLLLTAAKYGEPAAAYIRKWKKKGNVELRWLRCKNKLVRNQLLLPAVLYDLHADVCLFPAFPVPVLFYHRRIVSLIADAVCFDIPESMTGKNRIFWRTALRHTADTAYRIVTISQFSKERIEKWLPGSRGKIVVAPCGIRKAEDRARVIRKRSSGKRGQRTELPNLPEHYLLTLSTIEPRKRIGLLIDAYQEYRRHVTNALPLVIAGRRGWMSDGVTGAQEGILFTGFVEEEQLRELYRNAELFIAPSAYEGFDLPPVEAQAAGCRKVLASDIPVHREILGNSAFYFRKDDRDALANGIAEAVMEEAPDRDEVERSLERFCWGKSAERVGKEMGEIDGRKNVM